MTTERQQFNTVQSQPPVSEPVCAVVLNTHACVASRRMAVYKRIRDDRFCSSFVYMYI